MTFNCLAAVAAAGLAWMPMTMGASQGLPPLARATEAGWNAYVAATEARIAGEAGEIPRASLPSPENALVARMAPSRTPDGRAIDVPGAWIHHWRGSILLPGATLDALIGRLERGVPTSSDVLSSSILRRDGGHLTVFLRVQRQQSLAGLLTVTLIYDTEHDVSIVRSAPARASSTIRATRISEVERAGTGRERVLASGDDHGFLRRWNSYWRYVQVASGVVAECESVSLSREAPFGTRFIAEPLAAGAAAESMTRALVSLRDWMGPTRSPASPDRTPRASWPARSATR